MDSEVGKMMDSKGRFMERFLQKQRFKRVIPHLKGDVMDFGGNEGELKEFVRGTYLCVNYDHSVIEGKTFDTIVSLAVIEHIEFNEVFKIFKKFKEKHLRKGGKIFLTTPTKITKSILEFMVLLGILNKENMVEHKHYWSKEDIYALAEKTGFKVEKYKKFQGGFNQFVIFNHKE